MKKLITGLAVCLAMGLPALAIPPLDKHPPTPAVTAAKAIQLAAAFLADAPDDDRYCSSVSLAEPSMVPAPRGASRHWVVTFQTAGAKRADLKHIYVDMKGTASATVPPLSQDRSMPNKSDAGDGK